MNLSDQACGAIMMALQRAIMDQEDVTSILKKFNFIFDENDNLKVLNPPSVKVAEEEEPAADA
tara:strand:- start:2698 stop:2886 length:189 start_codon:yes stop_codon:yes gene_type:complete